MSSTAIVTTLNKTLYRQEVDDMKGI